MRNRKFRVLKKIQKRKKTLKKEIATDKKMVNKKRKAACLSWEDYLLFVICYGEVKCKKKYKKTTQNNAIVDFPQQNLDMLTGKGQYAGLAAQITYDPAIYAQIAAAAIKA